MQQAEKFEVNKAFTLIVVVQFTVLQPLVTVHVIVEAPGLNEPLASFPVPDLTVAPEIWYEIEIVDPQLSLADNVGTAYVPELTEQNTDDGGQLLIVTTAGLTVIVLVELMVLPQASVAVHVSVIVPPQSPGTAV